MTRTAADPLRYKGPASRMPGGPQNWPGSRPDAGRANGSGTRGSRGGAGGTGRQKPVASQDGPGDGGGTPEGTEKRRRVQGRGKGGRGLPEP